MSAEQHESEHSQAEHPVLEVRQVSKLYPLRQSLIAKLRKEPPKVVRAVDQVSLEIYPGEIVGLMGESGCGKTTLGKVLCRLVDASEGELFFEGENLSALEGEALRLKRQRFQMLFQNPYSTLNPKLDVYRTLEETLVVNELPLTNKDAQIDEVLAQVGLSHKKYAFPTELSGGERRRVGLARLLLLQPALIVADEPVAGLDASIKAKIVDLMLDSRTPEMAYIFISHDLHVIRYVANRILVMYLGTLVEEFPVDTFDDNNHHPYTQTLLSASKHVSLHKAEGESIDFEDLPSHNEIMGQGCPYANRCPLAGDAVPMERCLHEKPVLHTLGQGHRIACHAFDATKKDEDVSLTTESSRSQGEENPAQA